MDILPEEACVIVREKVRKISGCPYHFSIVHRSTSTRPSVISFAVMLQA